MSSLVTTTTTTTPSGPGNDEHGHIYGYSDPEENVEVLNDGKLKKDFIEKAILTLNDREKTIIKLRKLKEKSITLDELGQMLKISKERVRQIETKALEKLKTAILEISQQNKEFFV